MVMSQTLYSLLKSTDPDVEIDVVAPAASRPVLSRMPEVKKSLLFDVGHGEVRFGYRKRFADSLADNNYSQAIVLPNSFKSALVPFLARIPLRTGFLGEMRYFLINDVRRLDAKLLPRMIDRFMSLGLVPGQQIPPFKQPVLTIDPENQLDCFRRLKLNQDLPCLGLCPGAEFGDTKRWPEENFSAVATAAIEMGKQIWLFGSTADAQITRRIVAQIPKPLRHHCYDLAGKTTLLDAIDLLSRCEQVVTNDSGLMHVAAAVGCRVIVVYGSTSPEFTPPLTKNAAVISLGLPCSPCFKRDCPLGHKNCLNQLPAEDVMGAIVRQAVP